MPDPGSLAGFHFLRPAWLLVIPLVAWLFLKLRNATSDASRWQGAIEPHLLEAMTLAGDERRRVRPYQLLCLALVLMALSLSGPAWRPEITPFTVDRAPLIVALELTGSMTGIDQPPTRLERAKQKLRDLLERRQGARTAVVAYAGSAHAVLPLTDDTALVELYLESLEPAIMPIAGDKPDLALGLAMDMLATEEAPGTVIFMTDGIDRTLADTFAEAGAGVQVLLLGFGTEAGGPEDGGSGVAPGIDLGGLAAVAEAAGGEFIRSSLDSRDIDHLEGRVHSHLVNTVGDDESVRWQDSGYLLLWPLALVLLVWSRRGWTVQWG